MNHVQVNYSRLQEKISYAADRCHRNPDDISLVAVTKTIHPKEINYAIEAGIRTIGENRVQETEAKYDRVLPVEWHMVGHLQTNKVKRAVELFKMIQSVDSFRLAKEISKRCRTLKRVMPVLVEVNTSGESSKFGCSPDNALELIEQISSFPGIRVEGLMTVGLFSDDEKSVRNCFIMLRRLAETIRSKNIVNIKMDVLSMGMTADFVLAIEEGSTMVRIGTAIFGERDY